MTDGRVTFKSDFKDLKNVGYLVGEGGKKAGILQLPPAMETLTASSLDACGIWSLLAGFLPPRAFETGEHMLVNGCGIPLGVQRCCPRKI